MFFFQDLNSTLKSAHLASSSQSQHPEVRIYPADPETFGDLHLFLEYVYEFIKGTRLATSAQIDKCEGNITDFFSGFKKAVEYYRVGKAQNSNGIMREGVFRIFDSFMFWTPIAF